MLKDGDTRNAGKQLGADLRAHQLEGYQRTTIEALKTWADSQTPAISALCLWMCRRQQLGTGGWRRWSHDPTEETGIVVRYLHLASQAGETVDSDPTMRLAIEWVRRLGSLRTGVPPYPDGQQGNPGGAGYALMVLAPILRGSPNSEITDEILEFLVSNYTSFPSGESGWAALQRPDEDPPLEPEMGDHAMATCGLLSVDPASELVVDALTSIRNAVQPDGGWASRPGIESSVQTTYYCCLALALAAEFGLEGPNDSGLLMAAGTFISNSVRRASKSESINSLSYAIRGLSLTPSAQGTEAHACLRRLLDCADSALSPDADLYADSLQLGISILEYSQRVAESPAALYAIPPIAPRFIMETRSPGQILFAKAPSRTLLRYVEVIERSRIIDMAIGVTVASLAAASIAGNSWFSSATSRAGVGGAIVVCVIWMLWLAVRALRIRSDGDLLGLLLSAIAVTLIAVNSNVVSGGIAETIAALCVAPFALVLLLRLDIRTRIITTGLTGILVAIGSGSTWWLTNNRIAAWTAALGIVAAMSLIGPLRKYLHLRMCAVSGALSLGIVSLTGSASSLSWQSISCVVMLMILVDVTSVSIDQTKWIQRVTGV